MKTSFTTLIISLLFISQSLADPLIDRVRSDKRLVRTRVGVQTLPYLGANLGVEIEKIIMINLAGAHYELLEEGYTYSHIKLGWPGLKFENNVGDLDLYRQVYSIGTGIMLEDRFEYPKRERAQVTELFIPLAIDFDLSYNYKKSGFSLFGSVGINFKVFEDGVLQKRSELSEKSFITPHFELGVGYSF